MNQPEEHGSPIETLESLREHLQWAVELEHATLPPYLCALYSLDAERNADAVELVSGVFVEEMIHLGLAANLLNAIGGEPRLDKADMLPGYPRRLPHGALELSLLPFGPDALEMFLRLEQPEAPGAAAESEGYETIAQFYDAVEDGLRYLTKELGEQQVFSGDPARQVTAGPFLHSDASVVAVTDLATALAALEEIVEQGEGASRSEIWDGDRDIFHPDRDEVAHYYRFEELKLGRCYQRGDTPQSGPTGEPVAVDHDGIFPMPANPSRSSDPEIRSAQEAFDNTYCTLLHLLDQAFNGEPARIREAIGTMFGLKAQAAALMRPGAGPTFEYVDPGERT